MSADTSSYDDALRKVYSAALVQRMSSSLFPATPEWRAWAAAWREEIPPTADQVLENYAWRSRLDDARRAIEEAQSTLADRLDEIAQEYGVKIVNNGDGDTDYDVDPYEPPHRVSYRTKDGAPPEPPMWPSVGGPVTFK